MHLGAQPAHLGAFGVGGLGGDVDVAALIALRPHEGWTVVVEGDRIAAGGPVCTVFAEADDGAA